MAKKWVVDWIYFYFYILFRQMLSKQFSKSYQIVGYPSLSQFLVQIWRRDILQLSFSDLSFDNAPSTLKTIFHNIKYEMIEKVHSLLGPRTIVDLVRMTFDIVRTEMGVSPSEATNTKQMENQTINQSPTLQLFMICSFCGIIITVRWRLACRCVITRRASQNWNNDGLSQGRPNASENYTF